MGCEFISTRCLGHNSPNSSEIQHFTRSRGRNRSSVEYRIMPLTISSFVGMVSCAQPRVLWGSPRSWAPASQRDQLWSNSRNIKHGVSEQASVWKLGISTPCPALGGFGTKIVVFTKSGMRIKCSGKGSVDLAGNDSPQQKKSSPTVLETAKLTLQNANASLPFAVVLSSILAFFYPPSFTWFTTRYYAPALGFLMFAVGINLSVQSFLHAMDRPAVIAVGYGGQFIVKPILGVLVTYIALSLLHLPSAIGSGLLLVACVSGAQLSNYATFMIAPDMAPLSIVMTALSTMTAVVVTPALSLLLLGRRLPVNVPGMMASITQIVVIPIAAGLALNKFLPIVCNQIRPFLPACSVLVTSCCVGAPLALNIKALRSQFGLILVFPIFLFHSLAFIFGYKIAKGLFASEPDVEGLAKTISLETGMQSSLLGLALANTFFEDPVVALPSAISTVLMTLMGFGLTVVWQKQKAPAP